MFVEYVKISFTSTKIMKKSDYDFSAYFHVLQEAPPSLLTRGYFRIMHLIARLNNRLGLNHYFEDEK